MDLLHENRSLIHAGKLLRQPETGFEWNGWTELFILLFDNYSKQWFMATFAYAHGYAVVMTKPKEKDGVIKYQVYRRVSRKSADCLIAEFCFQPIPLDLLTLANFTDPATQRGGGLIPFRGKGGAAGHADSPNQGVTPPGASPESAVNDGRAVFPCTLHHNGRLGGLYTLFAETAQLRMEWKSKLQEALGLRKVVQESNKVFEVETLSSDTFLAPTLLPNATNPSWNNDNTFTGKVTCSVPFSKSSKYRHCELLLT